jgi:predicted Rdx family selenoprotein
MLKSLIDAMPQLLLNVGLQLMPTNWKLGLAFIGASGLMGFVSGMIDEADANGKNDEADRLKRLQQQITDLIEANRKQQEYYLTQKRKVDTYSVNVNDAIITPRGTVYTHPEDYIIATKNPETLMSGGGGNVSITVNNNAAVEVKTESGIGEDGTKQIIITIEKTVERAIANGRLDGTFNAANKRRQGRDITN